MSQARPQSGNVPGGGGPDSLHDMSLGKIVLVGVVSLGIFAAGIFWAYRIWVGYRNDLTRMRGNAVAPAMYGRPEIGIVDQTPFSIDRRLEDWRAEKDRRLSTIGWIDRGKGIVHVPIEKAMQDVVAQPPDIAGEGVPASRRGGTPAGPAVGTTPPAAASKTRSNSSGGQP